MYVCAYICMCNTGYMKRATAYCSLNRGASQLPQLSKERMLSVERWNPRSSCDDRVGLLHRQAEAKPEVETVQSAQLWGVRSVHGRACKKRCPALCALAGDNTRILNRAIEGLTMLKG